MVSLELLSLYCGLYQLWFLFFKTLLRWRNISLECALKVICRRLMFRGESMRFILNGSWCEVSQFIMVVSLELYQFFFLFFKNLIRSRYFSSEFPLKVIFRRWMFRTSFWMVPNENFLYSSWCSSLNSINSSSYFCKLWLDGEILAWNFLRLIT